MRTKEDIMASLEEGLQKCQTWSALVTVITQHVVELLCDFRDLQLFACGLAEMGVSEEGNQQPETSS